MAKKGGKKPEQRDLRRLLRIPGGKRVDLASYPADATPAGPKDKAEGLAATARMSEELAGLQERLYAASTAGDRRRVLLVLQGMDTSGKGGTVKHVIGLFNPSGCRIKAFKAPTREELNHPFLWRVMRALPQPGEIGIFDRSHYEDVLIARVRELVPRRHLARRYGQISRFEQSLVDDGVSVVKVFLHISYEQQRRMGCSNGSTTRTSTGSSTRATSTSARCGPRTRRRTRSPWSGARRTRPPGTWCPPTASGTGTGRSAASSWSSCGSSTPSIRRATSTWRSAGGD